MSRALPTIDAHDYRDEAKPSFGRSLARWWWLPLLGLLLGVAAAYAISKAMEPKYSSYALLRINETLSDRDILDLPAGDEKTAEQKTSELSVSVHNDETAAAAIRDLHATGKMSVEDVQDRTEASVDSTTGLVKLSATGGTPDDAQALANAYANAYIRQQSRIDRARLVLGRKTLSRQLKDAKKALKRVSKAKRGGLSQGDSQQVDQISERKRQLQMLTALRPRTLSLAQPAALGEPAGIAPLLMMIGGGLIGLLLGLGAVAALAATRRRADIAPQLEHAAGAPVLATIKPRSREGEVDRQLALALAYLIGDKDDGDGRARSIMLTSASGEADVRSVGRRLAAVASSELGTPVPCLHVDDGAGPSPGERHNDDRDVAEAGERAEHDAGHDTAGPPSSEHTIAARDLHGRLGSGRVVVITGAPVTADAAAVHAARAADRVVLVCRRGRTRTDALERSRDALASIGRRPDGVLAYGFDRG